jgi:predicted PurR-regulated permease PerM
MQKLPFTIRLASWLIIAVLGTIIVVYTKQFLLPIIIAGLLSLLLYPLYKKLRQWKVPGVLSVLLTVLVVVALLVTVVLFVSKELSSMVADLGGLSDKINSKFNMLSVYFAGHLNLDDAAINNMLGNVKAKLLDSAGVLVSGTITGTTDLMSMLALIIVYVFCFLLYNRAFKTFAFALLVDEKQSQASALISQVQKLVQSYLVGLMTVILIIGTLNTVGLFIIGIDHPVFFAFLAAMLTVIPYVGITIGALITVFYALLTKDTVWPAVAVMSVMFSIQFLESNLITPRIVGSRLSINPFVAIVVLLIGEQVWGIPGMILSVPLTAILKLLFDVYPSTHAIGYFIGSEFTDKTNDPKVHLHHLKDDEGK